MQRNIILRSRISLAARKDGIVAGFVMARADLGDFGRSEPVAVLDTIEDLPVRVVIPGHGRPFTDVAAALARARSRLRSFRADPARHARHAAKVLIKYHLMEVQEEAWEDWLRWCHQTPLMTELWHRHGRQELGDHAQWCTRLLEELAASGAVARSEGRVWDPSTPLQAPPRPAK
jgi:hypothetical protein